MAPFLRHDGASAVLPRLNPPAVIKCMGRFASPRTCDRSYGADSLVIGAALRWTNGTVQFQSSTLTRLSECLVCGGIFTFEESWAHYISTCKVSPEQPFAIVAGRGWG